MPEGCAKLEARDVIPFTSRAAAAFALDAYWFEAAEVVIFGVCHPRLAAACCRRGHGGEEPNAKVLVDVPKVEDALVQG